MTDLLRPTLDQRADSALSPSFDTDEIMRAGERRLRRSRVTTGVAVAGAACVVVTAALFGPQLPGGDTTDGQGLIAEQRLDTSRRFVDRRPTYALGSVIHYGGTTIDVGKKIETFVQTDDGFVFTTADGSVQLADGVSVSAIGRTAPEAPYLKSDDSGSLAAWIEDVPGERPTLVVYDTADDGEVLRTSEGTTRNMTALRDSHAAFVYAVDDGLVYWRTAEGMVKVEAETGASELVLPGATAFSVLDVASGHFAHMVDGSDRLRVSADLTQPGPRMPWGWDGDLSPDGRFVAADQGDRAAIFDALTGEDVTPRAQGYVFRSFYAWLDNSRVSLLAVARTGAESVTVDILECSVSVGSCAVVADDVVESEDVAEGVDLALPTGTPLFPA